MIQISGINNSARLALIGVLGLMLFVFLYIVVTNKSNPSTTPNPTPPPKRQSGQKTIRGVYAVIEWNQEPRGETWENEYAHGIVAKTYWKDVNPQRETYDWEYLDRIFKQAANHNKKVHLIIAPGFYSPEWVLNDPNVQKAEFIVPQGPYKGQRKQLPLPWNDTYLSTWFTFVRKAAERYGNNSTLAYVSATGPNSHNGEVALPREKQDEKIWLNVATGTTYEDKKINLEHQLIFAWDRTIKEYCNAFEGKKFTIALINQSFPLGGDAITQQSYKQKLVDLGVSRCTKTFGIQTNGLDGRPVYPQKQGPLPHWELIDKYAGMLLTGFQTQAPSNLYPSGNAETKSAILRQTIEHALARKAHFIEIYESDTLNRSMQSALEYASKQF